MTISVRSDQFKNIVEIWDSGPNTLHVVTASYRTIRISALGNIRSGSAPNYFAHYEEHVEIESKPGQRLRVWADAHFLWQDGADVEECSTYRMAAPPTAPFPPVPTTTESTPSGAQPPPRLQRAGHHNLLSLGDGMRARRAGCVYRRNCRKVAQDFLAGSKLNCRDTG